MASLWSQTAELPQFSALDRDMSVDVLIVGGGMAGLLCAYRLQQAGIDYLLLEAGRIAGGVSKNTTAKITAQHGLIYHKLLRRFGAAAAGLYLRANLQATQEYRRLCRGGIDCDFVDADSGVYALDTPRQLEAELEALARLGYAARFTAQLPLPFDLAGAVIFPQQACLHPLKFLAALTRELNIRERSPVRELRRGLALCDQGRVRAKKIVLASHFPYIDRRGAYFIKMHQQRSYVLALSGTERVGGMYVDAAVGGLSFREHQQLLLLGGAGAKTGHSCGGWRELTARARQFYPDCRVEYQWATQDCITLDDMPYIGPYSRGADDFFVVTGFNKWGMTSSMLAAGLICDLVRGRPNPLAELFSPQRSCLHPRLAGNALTSLSNLLRPAPHRCTHLGCALRWNQAEASWDCPCHGSRFSAQGELLNGPATKGMANMTDAAK